MTDAPLLDAWRRAMSRPGFSMQIPGHKMRYGRGGASPFAADLLADVIRDDIPLQGGADDNVFSGRYLEKAEALWAEAIGADHARFLVGGSTQGNIAALTSVVAPGVTICIDRTSHRSAHAGLVTSGANPRWILPRIHPDFGVPIGVDSRDVDLEGAYALFVTSPAYVGTMSDIASLATRCRELDAVLIVDQAWGAHLDFLPGSGSHAQGADVVTTSVHKALTGYSQTAITSLKGPRVLPSTLTHGVDLTATTSPSATLLASIDATRVAMVRDGRARLDLMSDVVQQMRAALSQIPGVVALTDELLGCRLDPLKITLFVPETGTTGARIAARMWEKGIGVEAADADTVIMTVTVADDPGDLAKLPSIISEIVEAERAAPRPPSPAATWQVEPEVVMTPREAYFAHRRRLPLRDAIGEVSTEQFCPYPPGVPLLAPGERITAEVVDAIEVAGRSTRMAYCSDHTAQTVEVVAETTVR